MQCKQKKDCKSLIITQKLNTQSLKRNQKLNKKKMNNKAMHFGYNVLFRLLNQSKMTKQLSEWLRHFYFHGNCLVREFMVHIKLIKPTMSRHVLFKKYGLLDKKI